MARAQPLLERTLTLLRKDKRKLPQIAATSGLNYFWIRALKNAPKPNPRVRQLQKLHDSLLRK